MKITSSQKKVTFDKMHDAVDSGHVVANVYDVVMDEEFIKQSRHDWCWLSCYDVLTETGWYKIDRSNNRLERISDGEVKELDWHERMFVYGSCHAAARENLPLALYIGDELIDGRLSGLYLCGPDVLTSVAQKPV